MTYQVTLFVGDVCESLSGEALEYDPTAFLINHSNYKNFLISNIDSDITVYTSLGDLPKNLEIFYNIAMLATEIVYTPPKKWADGLTIDPVDPTICVQGLTETLLLLISNQRPVKNIELCYFNPAVNPLADLRKIKDTQLWVAGCSLTHGIGVDSSQRYGQLVACNLDLPCSFLTRPGSSIAWAADQILRSDIVSGDIVIWGVTGTERSSQIYQNKLTFTNIGSYVPDQPIEKQALVKTLFDETTFYSHLYAIEQVINYCQKQQATLLLFGLLVSNNMFRYLKSKNNYFHCTYKLQFQDNTISIKYADLGTDNRHPGPLQHQLYADFCQTALKKLNYIETR
jgi:hypothetical protein